MSGIAPHRSIVDPDGRFAAGYNRVTFPFDHGLADQPLFTLASLTNLARRRPASAEFAYWSSGPVGVEDRWEKSAPRQSLHETLSNIAVNDSLVMLKHVEQDVVLGPLLQHLLATAARLCGRRMSDDVITGRATFLIASPRRVTAYHIDADTNFLLQIAGDKSFTVFDHANREVITHEELERYHGGDFNGAIFKPALQPQARIYDLQPGCGAHVPSTSPHWARNGDSVSIALSLNYDLRSMARSAQIYRVNRRLRRLGLHPAPPGGSRWRDALKLTVERSIESARVLR